MEQLQQKIPQEQYLLDPFRVATEVLLGAYLCSNVDEEFTAGKITEVEVYLGGEDKACHAYQFKRTKRTEVMFHQGGCAYIFFVYGMHHQFCVVTSPIDSPNAILIRALEPVAGISTMQKRRHLQQLTLLTTGPGRLCQALGIQTKLHNGIDLTGNTLWIAPATTVIKTEQIKATPRIGVGYAQEYAHKNWRFVLQNTPFVSK